MQHREHKVHDIVAWDQPRATVGRHFVRDMEALWSEVLKLAAVVEQTLHNSVRVLCDHRADLAAEVKDEERVIDRWEVQIETQCLTILALHQPVASDLRRVAAVLKINSFLERMADLAAHIAKRAKKLALEPVPAPVPTNLESLATEVLNMVHGSLDALIKSDVELARTVIDEDRRVDRHRRAVLKEMKQAIKSDPERVNTWLRFINIARNLERVADHATNIAEEVVYMKEGDVVRRHQIG